MDEDPPRSALVLLLEFGLAHVARSDYLLELRPVTVPERVYADLVLDRSLEQTPLLELDQALLCILDLSLEGFEVVVPPKSTVGHKSLVLLFAEFLLLGTRSTVLEDHALREHDLIELAVQMVEER